MERPLDACGYGMSYIAFFCKAEDGIRVVAVTGVQSCALPIYTAVLDLPSPCCPGLETLPLRPHGGVFGGSEKNPPNLPPGARFLWICLSRLWRDWLSAM